MIGQIVQFYGAVIEPDNLLLITELMPRGSLFDVISRDGEGQATWYNRCGTVTSSLMLSLLTTMAPCVIASWRSCCCAQS